VCPKVELRADVTPRRSSTGGKQERSAGCIQCIAGRCQPEFFISLIELPFPAQGFLHASAHLLDIAPAELVCEPEFVMRRRIHLIERAIGSAGEVFRSGSVIGLDRWAGLKRGPGPFPRKLPVTAPGTNRVWAQGASLPN